MVLITKDTTPKSFTINYSGIVNSVICDVGITPLKKVEEIDDREITFIKALWDTGATNSVVTKHTAKKLGLVSVGKTKVHHAGGESETNVFLVQLFLPNRITLSAKVTECDDSTQFGLIIGMDVICKGDFCLSNLDGKTTVSFRIPSLERIDFVKSTDRAGNPTTIQPQIKKQQRNELCACGSGKKYKHCCGVGTN